MNRKLLKNKQKCLKTITLSSFDSKYDLKER